MTWKTLALTGIFAALLGGIAFVASAATTTTNIPNGDTNRNICSISASVNQVDARTVDVTCSTPPPTATTVPPTPSPTVPPTITPTADIHLAEGDGPQNSGTRALQLNQSVRLIPHNCPLVLTQNSVRNWRYDCDTPWGDEDTVLITCPSTGVLSQSGGSPTTTRTVFCLPIGGATSTPSPTTPPPTTTSTPIPSPTGTASPTPTTVPPTPTATSVPGQYTDSGCLRPASNTVIEWVRIVNCGDIGIDVDGVSNVTIRNVWLEGNGTNVRFHNSTGTLIIENSILRNPEGDPLEDSFAQQVSIDKSHGVIVRNNDMFCQRGTNSDCGQEDAIGIFQSNNALIVNNKIIGGNSESGCGILTDDSTNRVIARNNEIRDHANCLIGLASGVDHIIEDNFGGTYGNVGGYSWNQYSSQCARHTWNRNNFSGDNQFWDGGNCGPILGGGNSWD